MKTKKKAHAKMPEVHVLGDLEDVKNLVKGVNKKKTVVIFRESETGLLFTEIEGELQQVPMKLILNLEKEYRFIFFDFFPGRKRMEPEPEAAGKDPEADGQPVPAKSKAKRGKKEKREMKEGKLKKAKKVKKPSATGKEKKAAKPKKTAIGLK